MHRSLAAAMVAAVTLAACSSGSADNADSISASPTAVTVEASITNFVFDQQLLEVSTGTTVTWTNNDMFGHTVTAGQPNQETGAFDIVLGLTTDTDTAGLTGSHTFTQAGTFDYFCRYHHGMRATVVVT